jgi:hypothetical protein
MAFQAQYDRSNVNPKPARKRPFRMHCMDELRVNASPQGGIEKDQ